jgi:hypothetical protein
MSENMQASRKLPGEGTSSEEVDSHKKARAKTHDYEEPSKTTTTFLSLPRELRHSILVQSLGDDELNLRDWHRSVLTKWSSMAAYSWSDSSTFLSRRKNKAVKKWASRLRHVHVQLVDDVDYLEEKLKGSIMKLYQTVLAEGVLVSLAMLE